MVAKLVKWFEEELERDEKLRMRTLAHHYAERAKMDGEVIRKTGEIIPKESA